MKKGEKFCNAGPNGLKFFFIIICLSMVIFNFSLISSSVVSYNAGYDATKINITQEGSNFFHLNISNKDLKLYFPSNIPNISTTIYDYANVSNDGTLYGGPNWTSLGYSGGSYNFDGVDDYILANERLNLGNSSFTFSTWIKLDGTTAGTEEGIFAGHSTNLFLRYNVSGNSQIRVQLYNGTDFSQGGTAVVDLYDDSWHHLVWVVNKSYGQRIYIDGTNVGNITVLPPDNIPSITNYYFGTRALSAGTYFNGSMDEIMIWDKALSVSEINLLYKNQFPIFFSKGELIFQSLNFSSNVTNVTLNSCETLNGSYIQMKINFGEYVNFSDCNIINYNISGILTNANLTIKFVAGNNSFYSPLIVDINVTGNPGLFKLNHSLFLENNSFVNSHSLRIYYDAYMNISEDIKAPLYLISDSWNLNRTSSRSEAKEWKERGYFTLNLETRGKGDSEGSLDASSWECLDIYEAVNDAISRWGDYINDSRIYLNGLSGAGGKTLNCIGKMPDFFTAVQGVASTSNYSLWAQLNPSMESSISSRIGSSYSMNPEAYKSRDGAWTAYNVLFPILIHHNDNDSVVNVTLSRNYNETVSGYGKTNVSYIEEIGSAHSFTISSRNEAINWFDTYRSLSSLSNSGDLRIGTFIRTKLFDIDLENGKIGEVVYDFSDNSRFEMDISTTSFQGPVNIAVKDFLNDSRFVLTDNGVEFAVILDGVVVSQTSGYDVSINGSDIYFVISQMSNHLIIGKYVPLLESEILTVAEGGSTGSSTSLSFSDGVVERGFPKGHVLSLGKGSLKVESFDSEAVSLSLDEEVISLKLNEVERIDLDSDGFYDVEVSYGGVVGGMANLVISEIYEEIPSISEEVVIEGRVEEEIVERKIGFFERVWDWIRKLFAS